MSQVSLVPVANIDRIWPHVRGGMQRALLKTGGDLETSDLWVQCRNGSAFLLIAHEGEEIRGASIWRPDTWTSGVKLRCLGLYGTDFMRWIDEMHETARRLAKDCGATAIISEGRPGWERIFKNARKVRTLYEETL